MMPSDADDRALAALIGVTSAPDVVGAHEETLAVTISRIVEAGEAQSGLLWALEPHEGADMTLAACGLDGADLDDARAALCGLQPPHQEVEVTPDGDEPFGALLRCMGAARGRVVPMPVGDAPGGLCLIGYAPGVAPTENTVRLHALRVGARCAGRAIEAQRLRDNLERAMAQILLTDERMLGRMGLDIHDGPTQQLSVALLEVQLLEAELADAEEAGLPSPDTLRPALARIYETVGGALHEMRELIGHLRPAQFEDRRLIDILQDAITGFEKRTDCEVSATWDGEFPVNGVSITQRITLYRILQETLTNAHRHGRARSVRVHVSEDSSGVTLEVEDDGTGFDAEAAQRRRPGMPLARFGLHGMRDRAQILGGSFEITSTPGRGTAISVFLPRWGGTADTSPGVA
jgi:signal transduction histidine kinase